MEEIRAHLMSLNEWKEKAYDIYEALRNNDVNASINLRAHDYPRQMAISRNSMQQCFDTNYELCTRLQPQWFQNTTQTMSEEYHNLIRFSWELRDRVLKESYNNSLADDENFTNSERASLRRRRPSRQTLDWAADVQRQEREEEHQRQQEARDHRTQASSDNQVRQPDPQLGAEFLERARADAIALQQAVQDRIEIQQRKKKHQFQGRQVQQTCTADPSNERFSSSPHVPTKTPGTSTPKPTTSRQADERDH